MPERPCPLPPAVVALLAVADEMGATRSVALADHLGISVHTVRSRQVGRQRSASTIALPGA